MSNLYFIGSTLSYRYQSQLDISEANTLLLV